MNTARLIPTRTRLRLLLRPMTDRNTPTDVPPTDRGTLPPPELSEEEQREVDAAEQRAIARAQGHALPDAQTLRELANELLETRETFRLYRADLLNPEGALARQQRQIMEAVRNDMVAAVSALLDASEQRKALKLSALEGKIDQVTEQAAKKNAQQDTDISALRQEIDQLEAAMVDAVRAAVEQAVAPFADRLSALERKLAHAPDLATSTEGADQA